MSYKNVKARALGHLVVACLRPYMIWSYMVYELLLAAVTHALDYLVVALRYANCYVISR